MVLTLRQEYESLAAALAAGDALARRDALKGDIIALFRAVDQELAELTALKDEVKGLVQRWKAMEGAPRSAHRCRSRPRRRRARTTSMPRAYIEKGWSLISLGEHAAAEGLLQTALALVPGDPQAAVPAGMGADAAGEVRRRPAQFPAGAACAEPQNSLARVNVGYICLKKRIFGEAIEHLSRTIRLDNDRKATLYAHYYLGLLYLEREMFDDAENFLRKGIALGPNLVEAYFELGRALLVRRRPRRRAQAWRDGVRANKFSPWGKRCAEMLQHVEAGGEPSRYLARTLRRARRAGLGGAHRRVVRHASVWRRDASLSSPSPRTSQLASSLLTTAVRQRHFPWLPAPRDRVLIAIAPDRGTFRELARSRAHPSRGRRSPFPTSGASSCRVVDAASSAGDPIEVLRHELAHLALHEAHGDLPPRWFDEGYACWAAREWGRDEVLATNVSLALRGMPTLDALDRGSRVVPRARDAAYALAFRAVAETRRHSIRSAASRCFSSTGERPGVSTPPSAQAFGMTQADVREALARAHAAPLRRARVFADLTLVAALVLLFMAGPLYVMRRRRDQPPAGGAWAAEREAERRERESAIEAATAECRTLRHRATRTAGETCGVTRDRRRA